MTPATPSPTPGAPAAARRAVTIEVADQLVALPLEAVRDVFVPSTVARVPLAPPAVLGLVGVRGHPLPALCLRSLLGLPPRAGRGVAGGADGSADAGIAVHVAPGESGRAPDGARAAPGGPRDNARDAAEPCALVVDAVGDVVEFDDSSRRAVPPHIGARWGRVLTAVHLHGDRLVTLLDLEALVAPEAAGRPGSSEIGSA